MQNVTINDLRSILIGTELGGLIARAYKVSLAVPHSMRGKERGRNSSGFSFGIVQLDIGNNSFAQRAYADILSAAVKAAIITPTWQQHLLRYNKLKRPDLDDFLGSAYQADMDFLNEKLFALDETRDIIERYTSDYLAQSLQSSVNDFLSAMQSNWGEQTVFQESNPDCPLALSAIVSISNRTGGLNGSTTYFLQHQPVDLAAVKKRYMAVLGDHWSLVERGANTLTTARQVAAILKNS